MFCTKCQKDIPWCTCQDIDKRMRRLAEAPSLATAVQQNMKARRLIQKVCRAKEE